MLAGLSSAGMGESCMLGKSSLACALRALAIGFYKYFIMRFSVPCNIYYDMWVYGNVDGSTGTADWQLTCIVLTFSCILVFIMWLSSNSIPAPLPTSARIKHCKDTRALSRSLPPTHPESGQIDNIMYLLQQVRFYTTLLLWSTRDPLGR